VCIFVCISAHIILREVTLVSGMQWPIYANMESGSVIWKQTVAELTGKIILNFSNFTCHDSAADY
jgi:hypothetical protein